MDMLGVGTKTITYHIPIQLIMISFYTYTLQYIIQYKCTLPTRLHVQQHATEQPCRQQKKYADISLPYSSADWLCP